MKKEPTIADAILELAKVIHDWNNYWANHDDRTIRIVIVRQKK